MPISIVSGHLHLAGMPLTVYILNDSGKLTGLKFYFLFCFAI